MVQRQTTIGIVALVLLLAAAVWELAPRQRMAAAAPAAAAPAALPAVPVPARMRSAVDGAPPPVARTELAPPPQPQSAPATAPAATRPSWQPRAFEVTGRVLDADTEEPIAGATVHCNRSDRVTDGDGRFHFAGSAMDPEFRLTAVAPGHEHGSLTLLRGDDPNVHGDLLLAPTDSISVRVIDATDGAPIAGCRVYAEKMFPQLSVTALDDQRATSDANGELALSGGKDASLSFLFAASGHAATMWIASARDLPDPVVIPLPRTAIVRGSVVDGQRHPVAGVAVALEFGNRAFSGVPFEAPARQRLGSHVELRLWPPQGATTTDEHGAFHLEMVPGVEPWQLTATKDGYDRVTSDAFTVTSEADQPWVEIVLHDGATITGRVLCNRKRVCEGAVRWQAENGDAHGASPIGPRGTFTLGAVPAGKIALSVLDAGDTVSHTEPFTVAAGQRYHHDLSWEVATASIRGRVTGTDRAPRKRVEVVAYENGHPAWEETDVTHTDADGRYQLDVPPGSIYDVTVRDGPVTAAVERAAPGATDVDFEIPAVAVVRLRLLDASTGQDGRFDLPVPAGIVDIAVRLQDHGYAPADLRGVVAQPDDDRILDVRLEHGHEIDVHLAGDPSTAARLHDVVVFALRDDQLAVVRGPFAQRGGESNMTIGDVNVWLADPGLVHQVVYFLDRGTAHLRGLATGRYTLRAIPEDVHFEPRRFDVPADGVVEVRLVRDR